MKDRLVNDKPYTPGVVRALCLALLAVLAGAARGGPAPEGAGPRVERFESGLRPLVLQAAGASSTWRIEERMRFHKVPGVSIAVIENGKLLWARGYGVKDARGGKAVDAQTVFSVGSVSKVAAACIALGMVRDGVLALDADVNRYLRSWKVPEETSTPTRPVTLRMLLSHTSGLSIHGFADYLPGEALPSVLDTLDGAGPAKNDAVRLLFAPGTASSYSGGGFTVEQLVVTEVAGLPFPAAAREYLFQPLGMHRSTFDNPLPASHGNIARAHDADGAPTALPRGWHGFPEMAASGLWTTPTDLAKMLIALMRSYQGQNGGLLPRELALDMMTEVGPSYFGLGPQLTGEGAARRFFHSGSNESYKAWIEGHLETGNGMVILTNGANGVKLYYELRRAIADAMGWPFYRPVVAPARAPDRYRSAELAGTYRVRMPLALAAHRLQAITGVENVRIDASGDRQLSLTIDDRADRRARLIPVAPLTFVAEDTYQGKPSPLYLQFVRATDGRVSELILYRDRYSVAAARVEPAPLSLPVEQEVHAP